MSNARQVTIDELNDITKDMDDIFKTYFIHLINKEFDAAEECLRDADSDIDETWLFDFFIAENNVRAVKLLFDAGIEDDEIDMFFKNGDNHLICAIKNNSPEMVRMLLDHGADINSRYEDFDSGDMGDSPLLQAVDCGNLEIVKLLLAKKPDLDVVCNGRTALTAAIVNDRKDLAVALLEAGAHLNAAMQAVVRWQSRNLAVNPAPVGYKLWATPDNSSSDSSEEATNRFTP